MRGGEEKGKEGRGGEGEGGEEKGKDGRRGRTSEACVKCTVH